MKKGNNYCFMLVFIAFLIGIFVFAWAYTNELSFVSFRGFLYMSIFVASLLLMSYLNLACNEKCLKTKTAFCHCGLLATIGATGVILSALFLALSSTFSIFLVFIIACFFFFFFLLLGGSVCFMHILWHCDIHCIEDNKPHQQQKRYPYHQPIDKR